MENSGLAVVFVKVEELLDGSCPISGYWSLSMSEKDSGVVLR